MPISAGQNVENSLVLAMSRGTVPRSIGSNPNEDQEPKPRQFV
jgi:hypothetical protein